LTANRAIIPISRRRNFFAQTIKICDATSHFIPGTPVSFFYFQQARRENRAHFPNGCGVSCMILANWVK